MGDKMTEMDKHFGEDDAYTAIGALGDEKEEKGQYRERLFRGRAEGYRCRKC
jgi:hypothetical protein